MIVLSESLHRFPPSASAHDSQWSTEAARLAGCQVYHIPQDSNRPAVEFKSPEPG